MNTDDILDIEEHPAMDESEHEWRKWAIGDREGRDDDEYKYA